MKHFRILDPFTLTLITVVLLASFFPARGDFVPFFENLTTAAIALLFFMHGAKLSREAIIAGGGHWRLHLWVMCSTFVLFPILGVLFAWWKPVNVDPMLYSGFLYLCILPATVQSAIAFTSMAGGNVAAAVCSASASSLLVVYTAFSEAVVNGIWHKVGWGSLLFIVVVSCVLLAIVIVVNVFMARRLGFNKADEITIVFCGSKKSLANGIPMANILFPTSVIGMMVLPLMIFHQIQLMVCAVLARRYKRQTEQLQAQQESSADKA